MNNLEVYMLPLTLVVVGAMFFIPAFLHRRRAAAAAAWSKTEGTVLAGSVEHSSRTSSSGATYNYYRPVIAYAYAVGGQRFEAKRRVLGNDASVDQAWAQQVVDAARPGSPVTVFYDPACPSNATLYVDTPKRLGLIAGGLTMVIGLALLLLVALS